MDETVPCETCGEPTMMTGTKRCNGCWELEARLEAYLAKGGARARNFVVEALGWNTVLPSSAELSEALERAERKITYLYLRLKDAAASWEYERKLVEGLCDLLDELEGHHR